MLACTSFAVCYLFALIKEILNLLIVNLIVIFIYCSENSLCMYVILLYMQDDMKKQTVSGALTLLTHLVKFKDRNSMNGFDSAKNHKMPDIFRRKFQSMFKDSESERIPVDKANLLISYVLVLSLHVDNFKTDPEDIAKDLRISTVELRKHFQQLGCKFVKQNSTMVATLPTPLNFPEVNRRRKTRK